MRCVCVVQHGWPVDTYFSLTACGIGCLFWVDLVASHSTAQRVDVDMLLAMDGDAIFVEPPGINAGVVFGDDGSVVEMTSGA